jgi:hypothetical protein
MIIPLLPKPGDLVKVKTKLDGSKLALVIEPHYSSFGVEWAVAPLDHSRAVICSPCDLEVISESR